MVLITSIFSALVTLATFTSSYATVVEKAEANVNQNGVVATFIFTPDGKDVKVAVDVKSGLNSTDQYMYHVHEKPLSADGNCTSSGGHLDPARVGFAANYKCNPADLNGCEVGDLSGKWGTINTTTPSISYTDPTLSLEDHGANNSVIGLSVVIHRMDKSRLACANITVLASGQGDDKKSNANPSNVQLGSWLTLAAFLASIPLL